MSIFQRRAYGRPKRTLRRSRVLAVLAAVAVLAWLFRSLVASPFMVPSRSMLPTLYIGDYLLAAKWPYGYSSRSFPWGVPSFPGRILADLPEHGDIIVFSSPDGTQDFVKRAIALPGDRIALSGGRVVLNGRPLARENAGFIAIPITPNSPCAVAPGAVPSVSSDGLNCRFPVFRESIDKARSYLVIDQVENPRSDEMAEIVVPANHVFVMGDNRDDSLDSRHSPAEGGVGLVALPDLIGRAGMIVWSSNGKADYARPWTWFGAYRGERLGRVEGDRQ